MSVVVRHSRAGNVVSWESPLLLRRLWSTEPANASGDFFRRGRYSPFFLYPAAYVPPVKKVTLTYKE